MARSRIVLIVFLVGILIGGLYPSLTSSPDILKAATHALALDEDAMYTARSIGPAIDLLLTPPERWRVYLPAVER